MRVVLVTFLAFACGSQVAAQEVAQLDRATQDILKRIVVSRSEATKDERFKIAAIKAADWAIGRPVVTNWNYNSFIVLLLAETYRITGDEKYLVSARKKALLGVLPGQLTEGPRRGRWADPHNARPPYHYIMVRGLASLAAVMPEDDGELPKIIECLRSARCARNPDFSMQD